MSMTEATAREKEMKLLDKALGDIAKNLYERRGYCLLLTGKLDEATGTISSSRMHISHAMPPAPLVAAVLRSVVDAFAPKERINLFRYACLIDEVMQEKLKETLSRESDPE